MPETFSYPLKHGREDRSWTSYRELHVYGDGKLITTFINLGLVDVYRLNVYPVILGSGKSLFEEIKERVVSTLSDVTGSKPGVVVLTYIIK